MCVKRAHTSPCVRQTLRKAFDAWQRAISDEESSSTSSQEARQADSSLLISNLPPLLNASEQRALLLSRTTAPRVWMETVRLYGIKSYPTEALKQHHEAGAGREETDTKALKWKVRGRPASVRGGVFSLCCLQRWDTGEFSRLVQSDVDTPRLLALPPLFDLMHSYDLIKVLTHSHIIVNTSLPLFVPFFSFFLSWSSASGRAATASCVSAHLPPTTPLCMWH